MKRLYQFFWDCGRMGEVDGLFIAEESEVNSFIGKQVYFGEILGKHSEIYGTLDSDDLTVLSEDQEKIEWLEGIMQCETISGYNPLAYININCESCGTEIFEDGSWYEHVKDEFGDYYCPKCYNKEEE